MAIKERLCDCGCGRSKLGTSRLKFFSNACKMRKHRADKKERENEKV